VLGQFGSTKLRSDAAAAQLATTLAAAHLAQNKPDQAREQLDIALKAVPNLAEAVTLQAYLKAAEGDADGALALLKGVLEREPGNLNAGIFQGDLLRLSKKDPEGALKAYRQALAAHPEAVKAHGSLVSLLLAQGRKEDARGATAAMKKALPNHAETLFYEAQLAFGDKDFKTARELAERILKAMPNNLRVLQLAGAIDYERQAYSGAEQLFTQALKLAPGDLTTRLLLAQTHLRSSQPERTLDVLQALIDKPNADPKALEVAADAHIQLGNFKAAEALLAQAAKMAPGDNRLRTSLTLTQLAGNNDNPQALQALEGLTAKDPGIRADLALISSRLQRNDIPGALQAIDKLQAKQPTKATADMLRGQIQRNQRNWAAARTSFEAALAKEPGHLPAVSALAAVDLAEGKPDAARQRLDAMAKADPGNPRVRILLAELAARTGAAPAEVARLLGEAVKANAGVPQGHLALVTHLLTAGDTKAALSAAQAAASALPDNADVLDALARSQLAAGNPQQSIATYRKLVAMQPTRAQHQLGLAQAQAANKDFEDAGRSLRRALELQPTQQTARRGLVSLAILAQRPQEGLPVARELQKSNPTQALGYMLEGDLEGSVKRWDAAAAAYRSATQRSNPEDAPLKLHQALLAAGKRADAERFAAEWAKAQPGDTTFRYYLGDQALAANDLPAAEAHYRAVLQAAPQHALAMNNIAWLLMKQGKPGALAMAQKANELAPYRPALLDTLASIQAADGQLPQAIETQRKALALAPGDASLKLGLARHFLKAGQKPQAKAELEEIAALGPKYKDQPAVQELLKQAQ
jgi:putative PEP-CTERM system TPR-repeat lipoprotein